MHKVYIESSNTISSLGFTSQENYENIIAGKSGVKILETSQLSEDVLPVSSINNIELENKFSNLNTNQEYTRFEKLAILSIKDAIDNSSIDLSSERSLFILSTTKGNIELLNKDLKDKFDNKRLELHHTAKVIADFFNFKNSPLVISNACISGVASIIMAQRLIRKGKYDHVIVNGTDVLSKFVISGFQSFKSLSAEVCKPFDVNRVGLNIGEASATIIVSKNKSDIEIVNGATSNDANHISGPSRTAEGQYVSISNTIQGNRKIDFISAHGTATPYNDDMESFAISRAELETVPTNSLKAYFGHTLGAAGVIESIISIEAMRDNQFIKTLGCTEVGVVKEINICQENKKQEINSLLKLASGFGGGNAAVLFKKANYNG